MSRPASSFDELRRYVLKRLELAKENQKSNLFWSGHIEGVISALQDVLEEMVKIDAKP
jgi:hypothetical protein